MIRFLKHHYHTHYHGIYQHAKKLFAFDLALLATATIMMAGSIFLFFWKPSIAGLIDLTLSLGETRVKSGDYVRLTLEYTNHSKYTLSEVSLGVKLPEGFIIDRNKTSKEVFSDQHTFPTVTEIKPGASKQLEINGRFWSDPSQESKFIANLSYRPDAKKTRDQKLASLISQLSESVLWGELSSPTTTFANSPVKFTYTLHNTSDQTLENISLLHNFEQAISEKDSQKITLPAQSTKSFTGTFISMSAPGNYKKTITPIITINNHPVAQTPFTQNINNIVPQIETRADLVNNIVFAEPGQTIPVRISWENKGSMTITDATLHIRSNFPNSIDWKKTATEARAQIEDSGIYFNKTNRTSLADGKPNSGDSFVINIYLKPTLNISNTENARLEIFPTIEARIAGISDQTINQRGTGISTALATEVSFVGTEARYYTAEGDQLGRGPLPPQVGKTTKYWIFITIANTTNAIEDVSLSTSLPEGVEFTGKQSTTIGPALVFNSTNRSVSWNYYTLPANSQTGLYFEVAVTPSNSQAGKNLRLTNTISLSATDSTIKKNLNISHLPISNNLNINDAGARSGSIVKY